MTPSKTCGDTGHVPDSPEDTFSEATGACGRRLIWLSGTDGRLSLAVESSTQPAPACTRCRCNCPRREAARVLTMVSADAETS